VLRPWLEVRSGPRWLLEWVISKFVRCSGCMDLASLHTLVIANRSRVCILNAGLDDRKSRVYCGSRYDSPLDHGTSLLR
jgi:hypothetical protein